MLNRISTYVFKERRKGIQELLQSHGLTPFLYLSDYLKSICDQEGVTQVEIISTRKDGRCVAKGFHPQYGNVSVKSVLPTHNYSRSVTDDIVIIATSNGRGTLFPRLFVSGCGYSIEEWVDGLSINYVTPQDLSLVRFDHFLENVRSWSISFRSQKKLLSSDLRSISYNYVNKILNHIYYQNSLDRYRTIGTLLSSGSRLSDCVSQLALISRTENIDSLVMIGDMHRANMLCRTNDFSISVVDYETVGPGHYGFDAIYLLINMFRYDYRMNSKIPFSIIQRVADHIFTREYFDGDDTFAFFTQYAIILANIALRVYVQDSTDREQYMNWIASYSC